MHGRSGADTRKNYVYSNFLQHIFWVHEIANLGKKIVCFGFKLFYLVWTHETFLTHVKTGDLD